MTAYFDALENEARTLSQDNPDPEAFLAALAELDRNLSRVASLNSGDREFPDDLRERVQGAIAVNATTGVLTGLPGLDDPYGRARRIAAATRRSPLVGELHSIFHQLAGRRIQTRFGRWSDDPAANLRLRDAHDNTDGA